MIGTHLRSRQKACVHSWPFRCYLRYLVDTTGYPWRAVTIAMDVPSDQFEKIIRCGPGQYFLTPSLARRILEFTPESLLKLGSEPASTQEIRALYSELRALGVSHLELARHCKLNVRELSALMLGKRKYSIQAVKWILLALLEVHSLESAQMRRLVQNKLVV